MLILLCVLHTVIKCPTICSANKSRPLVEDKILRVGEEMWRENLPLDGGSRLYQLQDLKPPFVIPTSFSIQLKRNKLDMALNNNRRLPNTENIIFRTENGQYVMNYPTKLGRVLLALLCLGIAFILPYFLPSYLLPNNQSSKPADHDVSKTS
ncbi:hypothetical protein L6164_015936 [Bauhinia variegata]|uniref:Uncharacterized protein n=1 Tax=Bauhinia variegata TaxID=167791 RepID=A0ACB9NP42_BAUVA|nr:hypothetical protein L6164_015936 [Bauhinia variegata]